MTGGWGWGDGTVALRRAVCCMEDAAESVRVSLQWSVDYGASQRSANCWDPAEAGIRTDGIEVAKGHFRILQCIRKFVYLTTPWTARIIWRRILDWLENEGSESQSMWNIRGSPLPWGTIVDFLKFKILYLQHYASNMFRSVTFREESRCWQWSSQMADLMRFEPETSQTRRKTAKPAKNDALLKSVLQHNWAMHHMHGAKGHKWESIRDSLRTEMKHVTKTIRR